MCCHPDLNQYILDVLQTAKPLLEKVLVILDSDKFYFTSEQVCMYMYLFVAKLFELVNCTTYPCKTANMYMDAYYEKY